MRACRQPARARDLIAILGENPDALVEFSCLGRVLRDYDGALAVGYVTPEQSCNTRSEPTFVFHVEDD
jgi:hypothetical protein